MLGCDLRERLFDRQPASRRRLRLHREPRSPSRRTKATKNDAAEANAKAAKAAAFGANPAVVQASIFAVEYSLAMALISLGVKPVALIGHSIGEYAAAAVAGALRLSDALRLVELRARSMHEGCEAGTMLSVRMSVAEARSFATAHQDIWLACENSPDNSVRNICVL